MGFKMGKTTGKGKGINKGPKAPAPKKEKFGFKTEYAPPAKTSGVMPGQGGKKK